MRGVAFRKCLCKNRKWRKKFMIRILQVVNIMDRAGLETMLMNYYRSIDRSQIQFDFLTHRETPGAYEKEIMTLGGKVYRAPRLYPQNYPAYFTYMSKFFREHREYKIIHSHIDTMSAFPLYAAKRAGIPWRIGHSHSSKLDWDAKFPIKYVAKLLMPYEANVYCACSEKAAKFMYPGRQVKIIHNAIDMSCFQYNQETRRSVRKKLGLEGKLVIGHVGRFYYVKNQSFLLDIIKEIKIKNPNVRLLLIGKGEDEFMLREKTKKLQIQENVIFLIDRSDVCELYQAMDIFVMPSIFEGLPVVGIEAQANGLPCLFSDSISKEVLLTKQAKMMSITQPSAVWADKILTLKRNAQMDCQKKQSEKGYDVSKKKKKLMKWYIELIENLK